MNLERIKNLSEKKIIKNTGWLVFGQIYQMGISLVVGLLTARYLGPSNYGTITFAASLVSIFSIIVTLGLEGVVVRELVANRDNEGDILGTSIVMQLIASMFSFLAIYISIYFLKPNDHVMFIVCFLQSIMLMFKPFEIIEYWYQSMLKSKISTIVKSVSYTCVSLYKVILLITAKSVVWFAFSTSLDMLIIAILYVILFHRQSVHRLNFSLKTAKNLISQSYHFIISGLMVVIYSQMDKIMIGQMLDEKQVGIYSAAITLCSLWVFIPRAFTNSARPMIMELRNNNEELYRKRLTQLNAGIWWIGIVFALGITVLAKPLILILYGEAYIDGSTALVISVWFSVLASLSEPRGIWILCENKNKYVKRYLMWGTIVNLILNFLLIPYLGINGSAIATLVTQIVTGLIAPYAYKETREYVTYMIDGLFLKNIK